MNKMKCYNVICVDNAGNSYKAKIETDETFKEIEKGNDR